MKKAERPRGCSGKDWRKTTEERYQCHGKRAFCAAPKLKGRFRGEHGSEKLGKRTTHGRHDQGEGRGGGFKQSAPKKKGVARGTAWGNPSVHLGVESQKKKKKKPVVQGIETVRELGGAWLGEGDVPCARVRGRANGALVL